MYNLPMKTVAVATLCLLLFPSLTQATEILIIDEDFNVLPSGYELQTNASTNATADFQIGNVGSSNGLVFDGTWDVPASGSEFSVAALAPILVTRDDFQVDPADTEGIAGIHWTLDAEVISTTMVAPEQGVFVQIVIFQEQSNGSVRSFADTGQFVVTGTSVSLDVTAPESGFGSPGDRPDFSATGRPMSFVLQFGATYPKTTNPDAFFVDGRLTADNWTLAVIDAGGVFADSFESGVVSSGLSALSSEGDCLCPGLPPTLNK